MFVSANHPGQWETAPTRQATVPAAGDGPPSASVLTDGAHAGHNCGVPAAPTVPLPTSGRID